MIAQEQLHMQIKTNWKKKNHYLIWQKNILTIIINCISVLVLSAIIVVTPSLSSSQSSQTNSTTVITTAQHNMVKLLADMVRNKLHDAVNLLEITSKDPVIQNVSFANFISKKYMGIPSTMDLPKRKLAQDILVRDKDFGNVYFVTPKADIYIGEPFSDQRQLPRLNYADRDWYKGVTATNNNTYISAVFMSASIHLPATAIATPVYGHQDNNNDNYDTTNTSKTRNKLSGYWVGILDLHSIQQSIKNLNLTKDERIVIVDHNGTAIVDYSPSSSAANNSNSNNNNNNSSSKLEDFSYLDSVKAVRKGNAGSIFETVNGTNMLSIYHPIQLANRFWGVVFSKPA
jgi:Cache domain